MHALTDAGKLLIYTTAIRMLELLLLSCSYRMYRKAIVRTERQCDTPQIHFPQLLDSNTKQAVLLNAASPNCT